MIEGKILKVSGPLVIAEGMREANMFDVVRVGEKRLIARRQGFHSGLRGDRRYRKRRQGGIHRRAPFGRARPRTSY